MRIGAIEMLKRIEAANPKKLVGPILEQHTPEIEDLQRKQLMQGLDSEGKLLAPLISEDTYFKSPQAAKNYADWKHKMYPETPYNVANLRITGYYQENISAFVTDTSVHYKSNASFAGSVGSKYQGKQLGLNPDSKKKAHVNIIKAPLLLTTSLIVGCKIKR